MTELLTPLFFRQPYISYNKKKKKFSNTVFKTWVGWKIIIWWMYETAPIPPLLCLLSGFHLLSRTCSHLCKLIAGRAGCPQTVGHPCSLPRNQCSCLRRSCRLENCGWRNTALVNNTNTPIVLVHLGLQSRTRWTANTDLLKVYSSLWRCFGESRNSQKLSSSYTLQRHSRHAALSSWRQLCLVALNCLASLLFEARQVNEPPWATPLKLISQIRV